MALLIRKKTIIPNHVIAYLGWSNFIEKNSWRTLYLPTLCFCDMQRILDC